MRYLFSLFLCAMTFLVFGQSPSKQTRFLKKDSLISSIDKYVQPFYYYKSTDKKPSPLIIQLHSWSFPADSLNTQGLDNEANSKNINYIFPNFRGVNNHAKACCSEYVIADIDQAIDWALENMNVNKDKIYIVGHSGGGYATLAMYMKSRHNIRAFSAWVPISDLIEWYKQSVERKNKYANEIMECIGSPEYFDSLKAIERSPLFWKTPIRNRKNSTIQIFAGIHDGYTGPVPISHSIRFYNKLLYDNKITDSTKYVSIKDLELMLKEQTFRVINKAKIGDREILYQKSTNKIMLTIFEGGHEMLSKEALEYIEQVNGSRYPKPTKK